MKEFYYDKLLNIKTRGKEENILFNEELFYYPYEPTSYHALEALIKHYEIDADDRIVDFGSGKGRLPLYLHHYFGVLATGIEMDSVLYKAALANKQSYAEKHGTGTGVQFYCSYAEEYEPDPLDNRFYFFNPFSVTVFKEVVQNIAQFYRFEKQTIELILYYASDEYISFLEEEASFVWKQEIRVPFLYHLDHSERFLIYRLNNSI